MTPSSEGEENPLAQGHDLFKDIPNAQLDALI